MATKKNSPDPGSPEHAEARPTFETAVEELGVIVQKLERGDLALEQSLALFERGIKLAREAELRLEQAERRVEELLGFDEQGQAVVREPDVNGRPG